MHVTHDQFTRQMRRELKTTAMGLGLVRLLQDARRFEEARATLLALEHGFDEAARDSDPWCRDFAESHSLNGSVGAKQEKWDQHLVCI